jgi:hypothetical protein
MPSKYTYEISPSVLQHQVGWHGCYIFRTSPKQVSMDFYFLHLMNVPKRLVGALSFREPPEQLHGDE